MTRLYTLIDSRYRITIMGEGFELTKIGCGKHHGVWFAAQGTSFGKTRSPFYEFNWVTQGKRVYHIQDKTFTAAGPRDIVLFPPGVTVAWEADPLEPTTGVFFRFALASMPSGWPSPDRWPFKREMAADDIIRPLFEYVVSYAPLYPDGSAIPLNLAFAVKTMLLAFIHGIVDRAYVLPAVYPRPVQDILAWMRQIMETNPRQKVTLDELADAAGVSRKHLCRLFQQHLGHAPLEVLYFHRLVRSLNGLRAGQKIESLAHEYGFAHASHYALHFRAMFGKSPTQMQRAIASGKAIEIPPMPFM